MLSVLRNGGSAVDAGWIFPFHFTRRANSRFSAARSHGNRLLRMTMASAVVSLGVARGEAG
jgi:hypothetical protein